MGDIRNLPPVAVFGYSRPHHLRVALDALASAIEKNSRNVYIFLDGNKGESDYSAVSETREVAQEFCVKNGWSLHASERNKGLADSIRSGVDLVLKLETSVIVIEDDIVVTRGFTDFCDDGLRRFRNNPEVASIHGYFPRVSRPLPHPFFVRGADCWGWATWADRWASVNWDSNSLLRQLEENHLIRAFDCNGRFPYSKMLANQSEGKIDSWAIRWHASMFLQNRMTLYPPVSLVENIGFDGSGAHNGLSRNFAVTREDVSYNLEDVPLAISHAGTELLQEFLAKSSRISPRDRLYVAFHAVKDLIRSFTFRLRR